MSKVSLLNLDALGMIVGLRFQGSSRYKTKVGSFFSIVIMLVTLITLIYLMNIYFTGSEFTQIGSTIKYWDSQTITMTDQFQIGVMTKVDGEIFDGNDIWQLEAYYVNDNIKNKTSSTIKLSMSNCQSKKWEQVKYQYELLDLDKAFCLDTNNLNLKGNYNTEEFSYILLRYNLKLDFDNQNNTKAFQQFIEKNKPVFSMFYPEGSFEVGGHSTAITYYINSINVNLTWMNTNILEINLSLDEMRNSRDNIIYSDFAVDTFFAVESVKEVSFARSESDENSAYFKIMSSNVKNINTVNYLSLTVVFARVGGIIQSFLIVIYFINDLFSDWLYSLDRLNELSEKLYDDYQAETAAKVLRKNNMKGEAMFFEEENVIKFKNVRKLSSKLDLKEDSKAYINIEVQELPKNQVEASNNPNAIRKKEITTQEYRLKNSNKFEAKEVVQNELVKDQLLFPVVLLKEPSFVNLKCMKEMIETFDSRKDLQFSLASLVCFKYCDSFSKRCLSKRRKAIYEFNQAFLNKTFEVSNTHKSFLNIQLLKYLLLNDSQLTLFENVSVAQLHNIMEKTEASSKSSATELGCLATTLARTEVVTFEEITKKLTNLFLN